MITQSQLERKLLAPGGSIVSHRGNGCSAPLYNHPLSLDLSTTSSPPRKGRLQMRYHGNVIRPPSEANSYILQVTYGCSHNDCTFCGTYLEKPFQVRPETEVLEDIRMAAQQHPATRCVFLADGDAMVLNNRRLLRILDALHDAFPKLRRISAYANGANLLNKSEQELAELREKGVQVLYLGLESGNDKVLQRVRKGSTAGEMIEGVLRARNTGIRVSVIGLLGLGGLELSQKHARDTAVAIREMDPEYFSLLTVMLVPGTELHQRWQDGTFELMKPEQLLTEMRQIIEQLDGLSRCVFRSNHASNYFPLAGTLSRDKERLLHDLGTALDSGRSAFRPELWRGL